MAGNYAHSGRPTKTRLLTRAMIFTVVERTLTDSQPASRDKNKGTIIASGHNGKNTGALELHLGARRSILSLVTRLVSFGMQVDVSIFQMIYSRPPALFLLETHPVIVSRQPQTVPLSLCQSHPPLPLYTLMRKPRGVDRFMQS